MKKNRFDKLSARKLVDLYGNVDPNEQRAYDFATLRKLFKLMVFIVIFLLFYYINLLTININGGILVVIFSALVFWKL